MSPPQTLASWLFDTLIQRARTGAEADPASTETLLSRLPKLPDLDPRQREAYTRLMLLAACVDGDFQLEERELLQAQLTRWPEAPDGEGEAAPLDLDQILARLGGAYRERPVATLREEAEALGGAQREPALLHVLVLLQLHGFEIAERAFARELARAMDLSDARFAELLDEARQIMA